MQPQAILRLELLERGIRGRQTEQQRAIRIRPERRVGRRRHPTDAQVWTRRWQIRGRPAGWRRAGRTDRQRIDPGVVLCPRDHHVQAVTHLGPGDQEVIPTRGGTELLGEFVWAAPQRDRAQRLHPGWRRRNRRSGRQRRRRWSRQRSRRRNEGWRRRRNERRRGGNGRSTRRGRRRARDRRLTRRGCRCPGSRRRQRTRWCSEREGAEEGAGKREPPQHVTPAHGRRRRGKRLPARLHGSSLNWHGSCTRKRSDVPSIPRGRASQVAERGPARATTITKGNCRSRISVLNVKGA